MPVSLLGAVVGLDDGARVNEIAQLMLDDVLADDGVYYLNLESDSENGKKLKTPIPAARFRFILR